MRALKAERILAGGLLWCLVSSLMAQATARAELKNDPPEEPKRLNEAIENRSAGTTCCRTQRRRSSPQFLVLRWRNVVRGQEEKR